MIPFSGIKKLPPCIRTLVVKNQKRCEIVKVLHYSCAINIICPLHHISVTWSYISIHYFSCQQLFSTLFD